MVDKVAKMTGSMMNNKYNGPCNKNKGILLLAGP